MEQEMPDYETIRAAVTGEKWALEKVLDCYGDEINHLAMVKKRQPDGTTKEEIDEAYEKNTGVLIVEHFKGTEYMAMPAVLCKNHGPFTWGTDPHNAVHNAVVLEEVAKMAARCEMINPDVKPAPQELQDKHYYRKHGKDAYYGQ